MDGTKIRASASKHKSLRYDRAGELTEQLDAEVKELLEQAEAAENTEIDEGQRLPEEIARRQALKTKMEQAYNAQAVVDADGSQLVLSARVSQCASDRNELQADPGRALYARRKQTVEPVFGIIKHVMGFRQFLLRGTEKVSGEWQLVTLAYHMKRLWNLKLAVG